MNLKRIANCLSRLSTRGMKIDIFTTDKACYFGGFFSNERNGRGTVESGALFFMVNLQKWFEKIQVHPITLLLCWSQPLSYQDRYGDK